MYNNKENIRTVEKVYVPMWSSLNGATMIYLDIWHEDLYSHIDKQQLCMEDTMPIVNLRVKRSIEEQKQLDAKLIAENKKNETNAVFKGKKKIEQIAQTFENERLSHERKYTRIQIWTDGAVSGNGKQNVGGGGYGAVLLYGGIEQELYYYDTSHDATNQTMEMYAVIMALSELKTKNIPVDIYSDSGYIVDCFNEKWYVSWQLNGWMNSQNKPVANQELWELMIALVNEQKEVTWNKVNGHIGCALNERADRLAVMGKKMALEVGNDV